MTPDLNEDIKNVCEQIIRMIAPDKIILFSQKFNVKNEILSFKLCIILETHNKNEDEKRIYLQTDSDMPFDVVIYTPNEWLDHCESKGSFAHRLKYKGTVVYEKAK